MLSLVCRDETDTKDLILDWCGTLLEGWVNVPVYIRVYTGWDDGHV